MWDICLYNCYLKYSIYILCLKDKLKYNCQVNHFMFFLSNLDLISVYSGSVLNLKDQNKVFWPTNFNVDSPHLVQSRFL
jgi:hypothetical protein